MYSIFAPLDDDESTKAGELWVWGFLRRTRRRRKVNGEEWIPAMFMFVRRFG